MLQNIILGFIILLFVIPFGYIIIYDIVDVAKRIINFTKLYIVLLINKLS